MAKKPMQMRNVLWSSAFFLIFVLACASQIRKVTYPPDFTYLNKKELSSTMWNLAMGVSNLHRLLAKEEDGGLRQLDIVSQLKQMKTDAEPIARGTVKTNHLIVSENIDDLLNELNRAIVAAERKPPNYYLAGRITGVCTHCHSLRP